MVHAFRIDAMLIRNYFPELKFNLENFANGLRSHKYGFKIIKIAMITERDKLLL